MKKVNVRKSKILTQCQPASVRARVWEGLKKFWRDESGQTTTEYVLILAIILVIVSRLRRNLGGTLDNAVTGIDTKMNDIINSSQ